MQNKSMVKERENLVKIKEKIRYCKNSREWLIREINEINRNFSNGLISREGYDNFFSQRFDGKTRLEWIDFCNRYIEEKGELVDNYRKEVRERINFRVALPVLVVLMLFVFALFLPLKPTGFITLNEEFNYSDNVSLVINNGYNYIWVVSNYGNLKSIRLDGSFVPKSLSKAQTVSKEGYAKVYLEYNDRLYLIFDSSRLSEEGIGSVMGLVVGTNQGSLEEINASESLNNNSIIDNSLKDESIINNSLKLIKITTQGGGSKAVEDVFEFNISGGFNWDVDYSKLCTMWSLTSSNSLNLPTGAELDEVSHPDSEEGSAELINKVDLCYGSNDCCALIGLESLGKWNDSLYLSYGRYGAGFNNIVRAQVIYANYSLDIEHPYADIIYSDSVEITTEFYKAAIHFTDVCIETCLLPGFNESSYRLVFVIENATLQIDNIRYSVEKMVNISRNAPKLVKEIENITIYKYGFMKLNLSEYFYDEDNDRLTYAAYEVDNISAIMMYNIALLVPEHNFTGRRYMYFTASDGYYKVSSNIFSVNVIEKPLSVSEVNVSEELIKPIIVINEPVKWVKMANASASVINLSVNISSDALNVTVRDVKENRIISEDRIKINDNGTIKNVSAYMAEKRIEQIEMIEDELTRKKEGIIIERPTAKQEIGSINKELLELENERNKLTGYVVAVREKGLLTRFFEWLFNVDITGYAVKDKVKEEKNKTKDIEVIIEEPVEDIEIVYYTEAPVAEEVYVNEYIKRIIVSSDVHYENILAYTNISQEVSSSAIRLYRIVNESRELVNNVSYYDENNNSLIDRIEWIVPSLSNETYELVIEISKAVHLDSNRSFISDIYEQVKALDGNWSEAINNNEYVRVTFKRALDNTRDITIYTRASNNNSAEIEVYVENNDTLITKFENISLENWYKVYLTNLNGSYDVFDLRIKGSVEFDYIVDPKIGPSGNISFVDPTPPDGTNTTNTSIEINVSIEANLSEVKFNWNGTNYTIYNDSLVLMMNFDNISALGEQTSGSSNKTVDVSGYGHNGTLYGGDGPNWTSNGRYGGAFDFDGDVGADDYIMLPHSTAWNFTGPFSISVWIKTDANPGLDGIVTRGTSSPYVWYLRFLSSATLEFAINGNSVTYSWTPTIGVWYHIVAVWNSTNIIIYRDGAFRNSAAQTVAPTANSDRVYIGVDYTPTSGRVFPGLIDEVMIWNRSLSADEIKQLYFCNLRKYDTDEWTLYVNQSKDGSTRLPNGTYTYYAYAKDSAGNENVTETRTIYINSTIPDITLNNPADGANLSSNFITFNWTVTDITDDSLTCNLTINRTVNKSNIATTSGTHQNFTPTSFAEGFYLWNVTCWDDDNNVNTSVTRNFTVDYLYSNCYDTDGNVTITSDTYWVKNYTCENVVVTNNAILGFNNSNAGNTSLWLKANTTRIDPGASISTYGKGYTGGTTGGVAGNGNGGGDSGTTGGGGGYGGIGGCGDSCADAVGGGVYGSLTKPIDLGSGGGGGAGSRVGGAGGGAIFLNISNTLEVDGAINASGVKGQDGTSFLSIVGAGGGSGGSIYIITNIFNGSGTIDASGGDGGDDPSPGYNEGGGGAGGRIAIEYTTYNFTGRVSAYGGTGPGTAGEGGAGTIFLNSSSHTYGDLIIANNNLTVDNAGTLLNETSYTFDNVTLRDGGLLKLNYTSSFNSAYLNIKSGEGGLDVEVNIPSNPFFANVTVFSGANLTHSSQGSSYIYSLMLRAENVIVESGGMISVKGKGYSGGTTNGVAGNGSGGGGSGSTGGGGGYGGIGGCGDSCADAVGGGVYGSLTMPLDLGSGGGGGAYTVGGAGGGVIFLNISDKLIMDGTINASGAKGQDGGVGLSVTGAGGGSGGSIYIITNIFNGTGTIDASGGNGGDDPSPGYNEGGGGAGGRIAIEYTTYNFTGRISAYGGTGPGSAGEAGAGTIFLNSSSHTYGELIIANNNLTVDNAGTLLNGTSYTFDNTTLKEGGSLVIHNLTSFLGGNLYVTSGIGGLHVNKETSTLPIFKNVTIYSGASLSHSTLDDFDNYSLRFKVENILIESTANISTDRTGYLGATNNLSINGGLIITTNQTFVINGSLIQLWGSIIGNVNITAVNLTIKSGGIINATGKGYDGATATNGNGTGPGKGYGSGSDGGGAGYGGIGGYGDGGSPAGGSVYGSLTKPIELGSGGGAGSTTDGGDGGGAIFLNVTNTLNVSGILSADGNDGPGPIGGYGGGGGSGGSVWIIANTVTGTGNITSNGGDGGDAGWDGGGGAGGRIAIFTITDQFTGSIIAYNSTGPSTAGEGNAGSIFKCNYISGFDCRGDDQDKLILENGSVRLETAFDFNYSVNITREVASYWNDSYVKFNDTSSNLTRVATYNASGLLASTMYNLKDNSVRFNVTFTDGGGVLPIYSRTLSSEHEMLIEKTIDADEPWVTIVYPVNGVTYTIDVTQLNYTVLDTNNDSCWYSTDNGATNSTAVPAGQNFTNVVSVEGSNTWIVWCNDTLGNQGSDNVTFTIDLPPQINFTSPTPANGTSQTQNYVEVNVSIIEKVSLNEVKFNWNGSNYTYYNDSLVLMMNFDNRSSLSECTIRNQAGCVKDMSRYGNNGTLGNATSGTDPTWNGTGRYGGAFRFDGVDDHVDVGNDTSLDITGDITITAWIKTTEGRQWRQIVSRYNPSGNAGYGFALNADALNSGKLSFWSSTYGSWVTGSSSVRDGLWHHAAVTLKGTAVNFYVGGVPDGTATSAAPPSTNQNFTIGARNDAQYNFNGTIDEVRIWNRSLSASEIYELYVSNLYKYNQSQWYLYVNQSKNATNGLTDGIYTYSASAKDTIGNENSTETRTVTIDTTIPSFSNNQTNASSTTPKKNDVLQINITVTDNTDVSMVALATNQSGNLKNVTNQTFSDTTDTSVTAIFNLTITINHSLMLWQIWANDSSNNKNVSQQFTVEIKNSAPDAPVVSYPQDGKNYSDIPYINFSSSDADGDAITYLIYINNTLNITTTTNVTDWNATDGYYNLTVTANDGTDSSANSSVRYFRLDTLQPSFSNNKTNASSTTYNGTTVQINITISDGTAVDFYRLTVNDTSDGTWINQTLIDANEVSSLTAIFNYSIHNFSASGGTMGWKVWMNDTIGNVNISNIYTFVVQSSSGATSFSNCINITQPGEYRLTQDIIDSTISKCIDIQSNNVTLDCQGYIVDGNDLAYYGIHISRDLQQQTNITVENCKVSDWDLANIYVQKANNNTFRNIITNSSPDSGIYLGSSDYNSLVNISTDRNVYGITFAKANNNIITNSTTTLNKLGGIYIFDSVSNHIYNNLFNNTNNYKSKGSVSSVNYWNTSKTPTTNIVGGGNIGGNFWANPAGSGFSQKCRDADGDDICDSSYTLKQSEVDYLPLAVVTDNTLPTGYIISPANNTFVNGNVTIQAIATDDHGVNKVYFQYQNSTISWTNLSNCVVTSQPYNCTWVTSNFSNATTGWDIRIVIEDVYNNVNNGSNIMHYVIDRSRPIFNGITVVYPDGQQSARNAQTVLLKVNVSDSPSIAAGMNRTEVNLTNLNASGFINMSFTSGSLANDQWSEWEINVTMLNASTGYATAEIIAYDNAQPTANIARGNYFVVYIDNTNPTYTDIEHTPTAPYNNTYVIFSVFAHDNFNLSKYIFSSNITGLWVNESNVSIGETDYLIALEKKVETGNVAYMFYIYDDAGNLNTTVVNNLDVGGNAPGFTVYAQSPLDEAELNYLNGSTVNFTYYYINGNASNCSLYLNDYKNTTVSYPPNNTILNFTQTLSDNFYIWFVGCTNNADNLTYFSDIRMLTLDVTAPSFANNQTNASSITYNGTAVQINVTITDNLVGLDFYRLSHNDTIDGSWTNESIVNIEANSTTAIFNHTLENFPSTGGTFGWRVWANDTLGNVNISQIYTLKVYEMPLSVSDLNITPQKALNGTRINISANITNFTSISVVKALIYYPNGTNFINVSFNNNDGGDIYYNDSYTVSFTPAGTYNVTIWVNDSNGNINSEEKTWFTPYLWLSNYSGIIINGSFEDWNGIRNVSDVVGDSSATGVGVYGFVGISGGYDYTCGIIENGSAYCWGTGNLGQLGDGDTSVHDEYNPVPVNITPNNFTSISAGYDHTCGILFNGSAYCWGYGWDGRLGDGDTSSHSEGSPVPVNMTPNNFTAITAGWTHTCGILYNGSAYCWGTGDNGQLGDGNTSTHEEGNPVPVNITLNNFTSIAAGDVHTCGILFNGTGYCWGHGGYGQLGDGDNSTHEEGSPVPVNITPNNFTSIEAGDVHTCGILFNGTGYCWGNGANGELGDGDNSTGRQEGNPVPVNITPNNFTAISAGYVHTCGILFNGTGYCWGYNSQGELGIGYTGSDEGNPVPVDITPNNFTAISAAAGEHACGILYNGTGYCWGDNTNGQLGYGDWGDQYSPFPVNSSAFEYSTPSSNFDIKTISLSNNNTHLFALIEVSGSIDYSDSTKYYRVYVSKNYSAGNSTTPENIALAISYDYRIQVNASKCYVYNYSDENNNISGCLFNNNANTIEIGILLRDINVSINDSINITFETASSSESYDFSPDYRSFLSFNLTQGPDLILPWYSNFQNNASNITSYNGVVNWSITLSDNIGLSGYIFAHNNTGTLTNGSYKPISGTSYFANETVTITKTQGNYICGQFWFNDTVNNVNQTNLSCFTVANLPLTFNGTIPNQTWDEDTNYINLRNLIRLSDYFSDPDNDTLTYSVVGNSSIRIIINQTTTNVSFVSLSNWYGTEQIYFIADDGIDTVYSNLVTLTVINIPDCGDNIKETGEECDGVDLDGQSCTSKGYAGGTLGCTSDCRFDTGGCYYPRLTPSPKKPIPEEEKIIPPVEYYDVLLPPEKLFKPSRFLLPMSATSATTLPCRRVNYTEESGVVTLETRDLLNETIPKDYDVIITPFGLECNGERIDLTINVPEDYVNVTLLKCKEGICSLIALEETTKLECLDLIIREIRRETTYLTPQMMKLDIKPKRMDISEFKRVIQSGNNSVRFYGKIFEGLTVEIRKSDKPIEEAKNAYLRIIGTPLVVRLNKKENLSSEIKLPYIEEEHTEIESLGIYAKIPEGWDYIGGEIDKKNRVVIANVSNISMYLDENNTVIFAVMGVICTYCYNSSLEKVYNGTTRDAIILVHGLASSPATFNEVIGDIKLTEQPFQTWVFGYSSQRTIEEISKEFSDLMETHSNEFDKIYIVAHSLGGLIVQKALQDSYNLSYNYVGKVSKVILVGVPNEGSVFLYFYEKLFRSFINQATKYKNIFNINSKLIDILGYGMITPKISGVGYYVIAGTNPYQLGKISELRFINKTHDGIVTVESAQNIGGSYINDRCSNYWDIYLIHTQLIDDDVARKLIERIVVKGILNETRDIGVIGHTNYFGIDIINCDSKDKYIVVGRKISKEEVFDPALCLCGNGVCGQGENELNCPIDCVEKFRMEELRWLLSLLLLLIILLICYYCYRRVREWKVKKLI